MKISDIKKLKNKENIVLLPSCDYDILDSVEYSLPNVFYLDYDLTEDDAKILIDFINNEGKQLILFDYCDFYRLILPYIKKSKKIKWVYKNNFASLTEGCVRATLVNIMEFYDRKIVDEIVCLDYSSFVVLKNSGYHVKHLMLDVNSKTRKAKKSNSIGIIGNDYNPNHNTYNELTALKLINKYDYVKIIKNMPATSHFINFFNIKEKEVDTLKEVMRDNFINLYVCFTFTNIELVLKSMDMGIPCLLGNTDMFDSYPKLKKYLVLNSDDNVNEIAEKIDLIKENSEEILKEYMKYRSKYSVQAKKTIDSVLK